MGEAILYPLLASLMALAILLPLAVLAAAIPIGLGLALRDLLR